MKLPLFCFYEDRPQNEIGLKFAVASLQRRYPEARAAVFAPAATPGLRRWLEGRTGMTLRPAPAAARGWDAKPHCLLALLDEGAGEVVWLDTDTIVTGGIVEWIGRAAPEALVVAQDPRHLPHQGTAQRATAWGLAPARELGCTVNTCVMRVTPRHRSLLAAWARLLERADYRAAQAEHALQRPFQLGSDQDALGALLGATEFAAAPVQFLRAGREVVHCGGLMMDPAGARLARLGAPPLALHAIAVKPWTTLAGSGGGFGWWLLRLTHEVSGYVAHARAYRAETGEPCVWLDRRTAAGAGLRVLGLGHEALRGLPLALAVSAAHAVGLSPRRSLADRGTEGRRA